MDKIIDKIVALGIPGVVLLVVISTSGLAGGAAIVAALAILGGPLGMIGGLATLGLLVLISKAITNYGFEAIFKATVRKYREKGISVKEIKEKVEGYPISRGLKLKINHFLDTLK